MTVHDENVPVPIGVVILTTRTPVPLAYDVIVPIMYAVTELLIMTDWLVV